MIVKYISEYGKVQRAFTDVSSMWFHDGNSVVSINRRELTIDDAAPTPYLRNYSVEYPIAIINLAPGESVEREDEPARS